MADITHYGNIPVYTTKDGSSIRELMHPEQHASRNQSLAEATVPVGSETRLHQHQNSEELYHITQGRGLMTLGDETLELDQGDTVCIAPQTPHKIRNTGSTELKILCCCAPAYAHGDTTLLDE
jgi:mannose-6-phosphate isomerase-like protein (cupin superfamily)